MGQFEGGRDTSGIRLEIILRERERGGHTLKSITMSIATFSGDSKCLITGTDHAFPNNFCLPDLPRLATSV